MAVRIINADVFDGLAALPDESVHCAVTSPPFWMLRDYGTGTWQGGDPDCDHIASTIRTGAGLAALGEHYRGGGHKAGEEKPIQFRDVCGKCGAQREDRQIGLEATPEQYVAALVMVFREVRRVLRKDGTLWLNLGDSYASSGGAGWQGKNGQRADRRFTAPNFKGNSAAAARIKPKDLIGTPWLVAFALRADGWWLRQEIIWSKPNPIPESIRDRCTKAHEHLFLLAKSGRPTIWRARDTGEWSGKPDRSERAPAPGRPGETVARWRAHDYYFDADAIREGRAGDENANGFRGGSYVDGEAGPRAVTGNNRVKIPGGWDRGEGAHGTIHRSGRTSAEYQTATVRTGGNKRSVWTIATQPFPDAHFATFPEALAETCIQAGCPKGGVVLDPFGGAGTTGLVADRLGRDAVLIELNPAYAQMAHERIVRPLPLLGALVNIETLRDGA